jgi:hypothetical protein
MSPKKIVSVFAIAVLSVCSFRAGGQSPATGNYFADASTLYQHLYLDGALTAANATTCKNIINYYFGQQVANYASFQALVATSGNTFLQDAAPGIGPKISPIYDPINAMVQNGIGTPTAASSLFSNLNATNIVEGLAQFLVTRGEQEISMAFFTRFQKVLALYPELTYLFPKTTALVSKIQNYNLLNLLQQLRDAFMKDLVNMPANILSLRNITYNNTTCHNCGPRVDAIKNFLTTGEPAVAIAASLTIIQNLINGNDIATALNNAVSDQTVCPSNTKTSGYVRLAAFMVQVLKSNNEKEGVFITGPNLQQLFTNKDLRALFFGLAYQHYYSTACYGNFQITVDAAHSYNLVEILQKINTGAATVYNALGDIQKINTTYPTIRGNVQGGTPVNAGNYGTLISSLLDLVASLTRTTATLLGDDPSSGPISKVLTNLNTGVDLCTDIQQKNYSGVFNDVIKFISDNSIFADGTTQKNVITFLSFGSNLASATTPAQVQNALEAVALPPGSYSIKQKSSFNISLNGYIGYCWDVSQGHGIYAPLGVAVSFGTDKVAGGAITLFSSIIDLGGIAAYDVSNSGTSTLKQNITFQSVISPSAQVFYEIPKWPVAFGCGWRMTPKLFYNSTNGLVPVASASVFSMAVLIDIPLLTLYNRPFK